MDTTSWTEIEIETFSVNLYKALSINNMDRLKFKSTNEELQKLTVCEELQMPIEDLRSNCLLFQCSAIQMMVMRIRARHSWRNYWGAPQHILNLEPSFGIVEKALQVERLSLHEEGAGPDPLEQLWGELTDAAAAAAYAAAADGSRKRPIAPRSLRAPRELAHATPVPERCLRAAWVRLCDEATAGARALWAAGDVAARAGVRLTAMHWRVVDIALYCGAQLQHVTQRSLAAEETVEALRMLVELLAEESGREAGVGEGEAELRVSTEPGRYNLMIEPAARAGGEERRAAAGAAINIVKQPGRYSLTIEPGGARPALLAADERALWARVTAAYVRSGRCASALTLQWRWLGLRRLVAQMVVHAASPPHREALAILPHPLLCTVLLRFPWAGGAAPPSWAQMRRSGRLYRLPYPQEECARPTELEVEQDMCYFRDILGTTDASADGKSSQKPSSAERVIIDIDLRNPIEPKVEVDDTTPAPPAASPAHSPTPAPTDIGRRIKVKVEGDDTSPKPRADSPALAPTDVGGRIKVKVEGDDTSPAPPTANPAPSPAPAPTNIGGRVNVKVEGDDVSTVLPPASFALPVRPAPAARLARPAHPPPSAPLESLSLKHLLLRKRAEPKAREMLTYSNQTTVIHDKKLTKDAVVVVTRLEGLLPPASAPALVPAPVPALASAQTHERARAKTRKPVRSARLKRLGHRSPLPQGFWRIKRNMRLLDTLKPVYVSLERLPLPTPLPPPRPPTPDLLEPLPPGAVYCKEEAPVVKRECSSVPAPVSSAPAPVSSAPAPVSSAPASVSSAPAPVSSAPAPVSSAPAPVSSPSAPVSPPPAPVSPMLGVLVIDSSDSDGALPAERRTSDPNGGMVSKKKKKSSEKPSSSGGKEASSSGKRRRYKRKPLPQWEWAEPPLSPNREWERQKNIMSQYFSLPACPLRPPPPGSCPRIGRAGRMRTVSDIYRSMTEPGALITVSDDDEPPPPSAPASSLPASPPASPPPPLPLPPTVDFECLTPKGSPKEFGVEHLDDVKQLLSPAPPPVDAFDPELPMPVIASVTSLAPSAGGNAADGAGSGTRGADDAALCVVAEAPFRDAGGIALSLHRSLSVTEYLAEALCPRNAVYRLDAAEPLWTLLADYIIVTSDDLPVAEPTYWVGADGTRLGSCARILLPPEPRPPHPELLVCDCAPAATKCDLCTCVTVLAGPRAPRPAPPVPSVASAKIQVKAFARMAGDSDADDPPPVIRGGGDTFVRTRVTPLTYESVRACSAGDLRVVNKALQRRLSGELWVPVMTAVSSAAAARALARAGRPLRCSPFRTLTPAPPRLFAELQRVLSEPDPPEPCDTSELPVLDCYRNKQ